MKLQRFKRPFGLRHLRSGITTLGWRHFKADATAGNQCPCGSHAVFHTLHSRSPILYTSSVLPHAAFRRLFHVDTSLDAQSIYIYKLAAYPTTIVQSPSQVAFTDQLDMIPLSTFDMSFAMNGHIFVLSQKPIVKEPLRSHLTIIHRWELCRLSQKGELCVVAQNISGGYRTNAVKALWDSTQDALREHCGQPDTHQHRLLHCQNFSHLQIFYGCPCSPYTQSSLFILVCSHFVQLHSQILHQLHCSAMLIVFRWDEWPP